MDSTGDLVKSTQTFSITLGSGVTSNTATITSVTTGASFVVWGGLISDDAALATTQSYADVTLTNGTTVTATRNTGTGSVTVKGTVVEFNSWAIRSIQQGTVTIAGGGDTTGAINSVTTANSFIHYNGEIATGNWTTTMRGQFTLTNSTTVTFSQQAGGGGNNGARGRYVVVEFNSGVLNSATQPVSIEVTTTQTGTATITNVTTGQSAIFWGGTAGNISDSSIATNSLRLNLTNGTTVTATRNNTANGCTVVGTVVEFKATDIVSVNRENIALSGVASNTATVTAVDTTKSFVSFLGMSTTDASNTFREVLNNVVLTNSTTVTSAVNTATTTQTDSYELIEFN